MDALTQQKLIDLNTQFYQTFGAAFAATRLRIQPGIRAVLQEIPGQGKWLDLGCGNGALGKLWAEQGRNGCYVGLDFSETLLAHAASLTGGAVAENLCILYAKAGLTDVRWPVEDQPMACNLFGDSAVQFDGVLCFAALHHVPSMATRQAVLQHVWRVLKPGGMLIHSEWQFQHSPKLMERRLPWPTVGLQDEELETGDTLLDWRFSLPGQEETVGYRYAHLFTEEELAGLAFNSGFSVQKSWYADGKSGDMAIYQIWQREE
jgi:tRNA (uracil-5-)-methyltransferase TRM9